MLDKPQKVLQQFLANINMRDHTNNFRKFWTYIYIQKHTNLLLANISDHNYKFDAVS